MPPPTDNDGIDRLSRRSTLVRAGGLAAVALGASNFATGAADAREQTALACVLSPEILRLSVLDASTCKPVKGAAVDIWHASAGGTYSGEESNGTVGRTYLRGIQPTDANGLAIFKTVYPGWYRGRAVHIHVKVHVGGDEVHTGQLFFRDSVTDAVYKRAPYKSRGERSMRNADDSIYGSGGSRSLLAMTTVGKGYAGAISMGVRRS
jgi:protocatechuate 3,4-dioxygenase beta subunit